MCNTNPDLSYLSTYRDTLIHLFMFYKFFVVLSLILEMFYLYLYLYTLELNSNLDFFY